MTKTFHKKLSNGQIASLYMTQYKASPFEDGEYDCWSVSFRIGESRKANNNWAFHLSYRAESTGRCGLEGLLWARQQILKFAADHKGPKVQRIAILGPDYHRWHAYSFLKRDGFFNVDWYGQTVWALDF